MRRTSRHDEESDAYAQRSSRLPLDANSTTIEPTRCTAIVKDRQQRTDSTRVHVAHNLTTQAESRKRTTVSSPRELEFIVRVRASSTHVPTFVLPGCSLPDALGDEQAVETRHHTQLRTGASQTPGSCHSKTHGKNMTTRESGGEGGEHNMQSCSFAWFAIHRRKAATGRLTKPRSTAVHLKSRRD
jgi:hypothetical protein